MVVIAQNRRHRVVTASGSATGINTPVPGAIGSNAIPVGGGRILTYGEYEDAHRYFNLFAEAIIKKYPHGGYSIVYNHNNGKCSILGRATDFKFWFDPTEIKNHYLTFRLSSDWDSYLASAPNGIGDYRLTNSSYHWAREIIIDTPTTLSNLQDSLI